MGCVRQRVPRSPCVSVMAEIVVATLDDPRRFKSRREVAAYAGLVPRQFESGTMSRQGRITGAGCAGHG